MSWPEGAAAREEHWTGRRAGQQHCAFIVFAPDELVRVEYVRVAYPLWADILTRLGFTYTHTQPPTSNGSKA